MEFRNLLKSGRIGTLELKNRIIMPPMGTRFAGMWGEVTDRQINWYARRAKGGASLIIVEATHAATAIDALRLIPLVLRADDECYIPGLACLTEAIHENGAKAGIQLKPGGGAQAMAGPWIPGTKAIQQVAPVSPSGVPSLVSKGQLRPRVLAVEEIHKIVELCGISASNCLDCERESLAITRGLKHPLTRKLPIIIPPLSPAPEQLAG